MDHEDGRGENDKETTNQYYSSDNPCVCVAQEIFNSLPRGSPLNVP
jgi:hypothetical protein